MKVSHKAHALGKATSTFRPSASTGHVIRFWSMLRCMRTTWLNISSFEAPPALILRRIFFVLAAALPACGPTVEFADVGAHDAVPVPRPCTPGSNPTFVSKERRELSPPPALIGPIVMNSKAGEAILIGGLSSSGVYANRISILDVNTFEHRILSIEGDQVELPAFGAPIWDEENERAIVIGGTAGGPDLAQVFAVRVEGNTAHIQRLADFPPGSAFTPAAVYDPLRKRAIVAAYIYSQDSEQELAYRATYALDLRLGKETWSMLVPGELGPVTPDLGESRDMVYDPPNDCLLLSETGEKSTSRTWWTLDLQKPTQWNDVGEFSTQGSAFWPAMFWEQTSCSFVHFTRRTSGCGFDAWRTAGGVGLPDGSSNTELLSEVKFGLDGPGYGRMLYDEVRNQVLILGGADCGSATFLKTVEVVGIER